MLLVRFRRSFFFSYAPQERFLTVAKHPTPTFRVLDQSRSVHKQMPLSDLFQLEMVGTEAAEEAFAVGGMAAALEVL